ncbi:unnamed protein product [Closterium sp. Yama58-4]|nr:unnamed protein product [Closterium sp. Yama58-4]
MAGNASILGRPSTRANSSTEGRSRAFRRRFLTKEQHAARATSSPWSKIAKDKDKKPVDFKYERAPCSNGTSIAVRVRDGSTEDEFKVQILGTAGPGSVERVEVSNDGSTWKALEKPDVKVTWKIKGEKALLRAKKALSFRVTARDTKEQVVLKDVLPADWKAATTYKSKDVNFKKKDEAAKPNKDGVKPGAVRAAVTKAVIAVKKVNEVLTKATNAVLEALKQIAATGIAKNESLRSNSIMAVDASPRRGGAEGGAAGAAEEEGREDDALARADEARKAAEAKKALRAANLRPKRLGASGEGKVLDSSIKRNTAVIRRLKQLSEDQRETILDEVRAVNMSKYVSEAVAAIAEAKLKMADIPAAVQVCSLLHQRYADFSPALIPTLLRVLMPSVPSSKPTTGTSSGSSTTITSSLFFDDVDGSAVGVGGAGGGVSGAGLAGAGAAGGGGAVAGAGSAGTGASLSSRISRKRSVFRLLVELFLCGVFGDASMIIGVVYTDLPVTAEQRKQLNKLVSSFFEALCALVQSEQGVLRGMEREIARMTAQRGEVGEDVTGAYEKSRRGLEQLLRNANALADALDRPPVVLPEDEHTTHVAGGADSSAGGAGGAGADGGKREPEPLPLWDDDETRVFYEDLPDLKLFVPAVLLGDGGGKGGKGDGEEKESEEGEGKEEKEKGKEKGKEKDKDEKEKGKEKEKESEKEKEKVKGVEAAKLDDLLQRLPSCVSRDLIDQLAVDFCYVNSKASRRRLVRALFAVPRTALQLLPYHARLTATLGQYMRDVGPALVHLLEEEFAALKSKKDQINIESKMRNIRFLGELAKFKVAPPSLIFSCLKSCLEDFSHHSIDVACALLETCGAFLSRHPDTKVRMGNMLDIIQRLKNARSFDAHHSTLIDNAYFLCRPPDRVAKVIKTRPPLHQYIRKLLYADLSKSTVEKVLRQLRKLPWSECEGYVVRCLVKAHRARFNQIHLLASLVAALSRFRESVGVAVVDQLMEDIRLGLEAPDGTHQQRRITALRFLGELYSYRVVDSHLVFDTLHLLLFFGCDTPEVGW